MADDKDFAVVCGIENGIQFALAQNGTLYVRRENDWKPYLFNEQYAGYYPPCTFSTLAYLNDLFYLAGTDDNGKPQLFTSMLGGVWEQKNLMAHDPFVGEIAARGRVLQILYSDKVNQIFLLCDSGQLITLPDCPKCVRILQVKNKRAVGGIIANDEIVMRFADGTSEQIRISEAVQMRVSMSFAQKELLTGGVLADVRTQEAFARDALQGSIHVPLENLDEWLKTQPKTRTIIFVCNSGIYADTAARYAKNAGYKNAYSLGGIRNSTHVD